MKFYIPARLGVVVGMLLATGGLAQAQDSAPDVDALFEAGNEFSSSFAWEDAAAAYGVACENDHAWSCKMMGNIYHYGFGVVYDAAQAQQFFDRALAIFQRGCEDGDAESCRDVGWMYHDSTGVPRDYTRAAHWFLRACEGGDGRGCNQLGSLYARGWGVSQDALLAAHYYREACRLGYAWGCDNAAELQADAPSAAAESHPRDWYDRGRALRIEACEASDAHACVDLGSTYLHGNGVQADDVRAREYFELACQLGERDGCVAAGRLTP